MKPACPNSSRFSRTSAHAAWKRATSCRAPSSTSAASRRPADLGGHRPVGRVELGDDPVVAVRLLDGAAASRPARRPTSATRWTDGARSGSHDGMRVERLMRGVSARRRGHAEAAAVGVGRGVDAARQVGQRLAVGEARGADRRARRRSRRRRAAPSPIISTSSRWRRRSPVSSGWKAVASTRPWRTATGAAVGVAGRAPRTPARRRLTSGARMKTPWSGSSPSAGTSRSASNESSWRP